MIINNRISGKTKLIGIIGNPIEHTISPHLHNTLSDLLGIDLTYVPFRVEKEELENAVKGLKALNVIGFNVTIPFKKEVMKYLDENSKEALLMGAVNTVKKIDGKFYGYNTDAEGFARSFKEETKSNFKDKKVVIFGAGGAARAISIKIAMEGAKEICIINRTNSNMQDLLALVKNNYDIQIKAALFNDLDAPKAFRQADIIINSTAVGMSPEIDQSPVDERFQFSEHQIVYDVIYNPLQTKFLKQAEAVGCKTVNGIGMLFYQGINAYEIWTGMKISHKHLEEVYLSFMNILKK